MIGSSNKNFLLIDIGCSTGTFTKVLSLRYETIGLDVDKIKIKLAKHNLPTIDFICADVLHMPIKDNSANMVVCSSVLEFIQNLEIGIKEIRRTLKNHGTLIVGYPINTLFLKTIMGIFGKSAARTWNPSRVMKYEDCIIDPDTHKQNFRSIRSALTKYFLMLERTKYPLSCFPDILSFYECVKLVKIQK